MTSMAHLTDTDLQRRLPVLDDEALVGRVITAKEITAAYEGELEPKIVTVAGWKGGIGKSQLAYELAWLLGAPLVDWDWDRGGVTRKWGYRVEDRIGSLLLDAMERGRVPRPVTGFRKPELVPSHPDLMENQPAPEPGADAILTWARTWRRPYVVCDTHPGGCGSTYAAVSAAHVIVVPVVLAVNELEALEGMLEELPDYPLLLIPYKIAAVPGAAEINKLDTLVKKFKPQVGPAVSKYTWLEKRKIRVALTSYEPEPARIAPVSAELRAVAEAVRNYG
jgi:chromosome partitioning protein